MAPMIALLALVCMTTVVHGQAPDNRGTEFVVAYMANYALYTDVQLFVTTSRTTTVDVSVTAPRYSSVGLNEQFTLTAGEVKQLFISNSIRGVGSSLETKGVSIIASDEVVVYGVNMETYSNDAFLGFPLDVLGAEYYTVSHHPTTKECEFLVVGCYDDTQVTIRLGSHSSIEVSYGGRYYYHDETISLTMNKYDTLQLQTYGDLTASYVTSSKNVALMSGNKRTSVLPGSSRDTLVDQMMPVDTWGKNFATVPIPGRTTGDKFRFIAANDGTSISIACSGSFTSSINLNAGDFYELLMPSDQCCNILSDEPIMAVQIVVSQVYSSEPADPALMVVPPIEQYAADYTFTTPKYSLGSYSNYFMFVVKKAEQDGLKIDGSSIASSANMLLDIPNTDYVGGYILVAEGTHTARHDSPISVFGGFMYGTANYETYLMVIGQRMAAVNTVCVPTSTVVGDGIDNDCDGLIDEELCTSENQGADDDGDGTAEEDCATPPPIDGEWGSWGAYTTCSISCTPSGGSVTTGTKTRTRNCDNPEPKYDGQQCSGSSAETVSCTVATVCPVDGGWSSWGSWGSCSVTCATGTMSRSRTCDNPSPAHNGADCPGDSSDSTSCNTGVNCPIDGNWGSWQAWGSCSVTCGPVGGTQNRERSCSNPSAQYGGAACSGADTEDRTCNDVNCPVDGGWSSWSSWTSCSVTCGNMTISRSRSCTNPAPLYNGAGCAGSDVDTDNCYAGIMCPIDGGWTTWTAWDTCTVTCAGGTQNRERTCTNPTTQYNGVPCSGDTSETQACNTLNCPIDGGWTIWTDWSGCSSTCGPGLITRDRTCTNPLPQYNGAGCIGTIQESIDCNGTCTVHGNWGAWSSWSSCTKTCAGGRAGRVRLCDDPAPTPDGNPCSGGSFEIEICNSQSCSGNGTVGGSTLEDQYVSNCPNGFFTCQSGSITCIESIFRCDCGSDCSDGSDETTGWASCNADLVAACRNGAEGFRGSWMVGLVFSSLVLLLQRALGGWGD